LEISLSYPVIDKLQDKFTQKLRTSTFIVVDHLTVKVRCSMGGRVGIPLTILTLPHFCAYPKPLPAIGNFIILPCN
jgi:hypothetical protein